MAGDSSPLSAYLLNIQAELGTGHAQEHSYRPALKALFEVLTSKLRIVNEPKGSSHGRPDFIFLNAEIPIAWVEAKDLHINLDKVEKSEQMSRYFGYPNLILTNGLEFRFYKNGQKYGEGVIVASKKGETIQQHPERFDSLGRTLTDFLASPIDTIRSARHLAQIMGGKAARLRDNIVEMMGAAFTGNREQIERIRDILKSRLIHDLTDAQFADLYAQTLVYGLFVARYQDDTPETFSRAEARERIPASNHLLQQFFDHIAGANFEKRLSFIVDELCDVFVHSNVHDLVHGLYQKQNDTHDPIIHFYEDFLREYNPKLRMERGVFYTPLPVVRYIVRSVDALLQKHFGLHGGLADRSTVEWKSQQQGKTLKRQIDRVQILDPAAGTGTFLNEVIRNIHQRFEGQQGMWPQYVEDHLIPRLHGFELMMASYTIAHLKLGMTLAETGMKSLKKRLRIFLTNSLEEAPPKDDSLFRGLGLQDAITEEALNAEEIKRDMPIMVVLGNPPYSVSSQNASIETGTDGKKRKTWIGALIDEYKKDLNERKINLDDDYIKFIRFSHHLVEKNGQGIVAMITNNSFLDGITHRRMRESLLQTFDDIYVLDLHGSSKRKEVSPDGSKDENVFDIQQGVSITLFVKSTAGKKKPLGKVHHAELYGKRESKYEWLNAHDFSTTPWQKLEAPKPYYFFVPKDFGLSEEYRNYSSLSGIFNIGSSGVQTKRDGVFIDFDKSILRQRFLEILDGDQKMASIKYDLEARGGWSPDRIEGKRFNEELVCPYAFRPFDSRYVYFEKELLGRARYPVQKQLLSNNLALVALRQSVDDHFQHIFCTDTVCDLNFLIGHHVSDRVFPLYLYPDSDNLNETRTANLEMKVLDPVLRKLKLEWIPDGSGDRKGTCGPEDVFDYIYAVLHSPTYRERYREFLKIDFPRVPFTTNAELFWRLVSLGHEIRLLHLMDHPKLEELVTRYPVAGDNIVDKLSYDPAMERVWINAAQYFEGVPESAWNFPIGGYQPAQKWLKDRKGRILSSDDLLHYQKMIVSLMETGRLMGDIDTLIGENGGWPMK